jgi:MFS family permease
MRRLPLGLPSFPDGGLIVFAAVLINMLAVGAALPILPRYVKGPIGASDIAVGMVIGVFAFSAIAARPIAGRFGDRRGRKPVMLVGSALTGIAGALYAVKLGVPGLLGARMILGVGDGVVYTSGAAWVADRASNADRGRLIGLFGLSIWGGISIGPLLGQGIYDWTGSYDAVWALCAALPAVALVVLIQMPEAPRSEAMEKARQATGMASLVPRAAVRPGLSLLTANVGYAALSSFIVLLLDHRGIGHGALAFGAFAAAVVVNRLLFGYLPDRLGGRRAAMLAASVEAAGLLMIAYSHTLWLSLLASAIVGTGFAMLFPSLALIVLAEVDASQRGAAMGTFTAFFDLGIAIGSPLVGLAASLAGYPAAFVVGAGGAILSAALSWTFPELGPTTVHEDTAEPR